MNLSTDDESSSESSSNECLVTPGALDLDSSFFRVPKKPSSVSRAVVESDDSESDDDFADVGNDKVDSAALLAEVMRNLENAEKPMKLENHQEAASPGTSPEKDRNEKNRNGKNVLADEIANLLLQGETGASAASFEAADGGDDEEAEEDVKPPEGYTIPKEGVSIVLPGSNTMIFNRRKKRGTDFEEALRRKMNQRLRSNQVFIHKTGLLCWLAHGFHLNRQINDSEVLSTSLSLVPSSSYPKGRVDLRYLEQFTKWFRNLFKLEFKDVAEGVKSATLLLRLRERKVHNRRELVLLYAATLRSIGLNCRLVVSLCAPPLKLQRDQLFQNPKAEPEAGKTDVSALKKEPGISGVPKKEPGISGVPKKEPAAKGKKAAKGGRAKKNSESSGGKIVPENSAELERVSKMDARKRAAEVLSKFAKAPARKTIKVALDAKKREETKELASAEKIRCDAPSPEKIRSDAPSPEKIRSDAPSPKKIRRDAPSPEKIRCNAASPPRTRQLRSRVVARSSQPAAVAKVTKKVTFVEEEKGTDKRSPEKRGRTTRSAKTIVASTSGAPDGISDEELKIVAPAKKKKTSEKVETIESSSDSEDEPETKSSTRTKINSRRANARAKKDDDLDKDFEVKRVTRKKADAKNETKAAAAKAKVNASKIVEKDATSESDSDAEFQPKAPARRKKIEALKKESRAKARRSDSIDRRVLSSDEEANEVVDAKGAQNIWVEVYVESEESWISVSVPDDKIHCVSDIYKKAPKPVLYVIVWNSVGTLKDVTRRYCPHWLTVTRKQRIDESWWVETLSPWMEKSTAISRAEDEMLLQRELEQPLPKTVGECKGHPLYALTRHLLKFEALYPPESVPLGHLKTGEAIYSRHCVHTLCSRETWIKKARVVKPAQEPYKIVKAMPKYDKLSGTVTKDLPLELFGRWQTTEYVPPVAKDGKVPRNEYGNVDLFKECMLPIGCVHINLPALSRVARKLNIDCVPAVVGFNFGARGAVPATEGFVVCAEFEDTLREAWEAEQLESAKRAIEKREKRIYGNWKRLIRGLFIRERLAARYDFNDDDDAADDEEKPSTSKKANDRKPKKS